MYSQAARIDYAVKSHLKSKSLLNVFLTGFYCEKPIQAGLDNLTPLKKSQIIQTTMPFLGMSFYVISVSQCESEALEIDIRALVLLRCSYRQQIVIGYPD